MSYTAIWVVVQFFLVEGLYRCLEGFARTNKLTVFAYLGCRIWICKHNADKLVKSPVSPPLAGGGGFRLFTNFVDLKHVTLFKVTGWRLTGQRNRYKFMADSYHKLSQCASTIRDLLSSHSAGSRIFINTTKSLYFFAWTYTFNHL